VSSFEEIQVKCPGCRTTVSLPYWHVVSVEDGSNVKKLLLHDKINIARCLKCGNETMVVGPFIYHDRSRRCTYLVLPEDATPSEERRQREMLEEIRDILDNSDLFNRDEHVPFPGKAETLPGIEALKERLLDEDPDCRRAIDIIMWVGRALPRLQGPVEFRRFDPIVTHYEIRNFQRAPVMVNGALRADAADGPGCEREVILDVTMPNGGRPSYRSVIEYAKVGPRDFVPLKHDQYLRGEIDLTLLFWLDEPGRYTVSCVYRVEADINDGASFGRRAWTGRTGSAPVSFGISPVKSGLERARADAFWRRFFRPGGRRWNEVNVVSNKEILGMVVPEPYDRPKVLCSSAAFDTRAVGQAFAEYLLEAARLLELNPPFDRDVNRSRLSELALEEVLKNHARDSLDPQARAYLLERHRTYSKESLGL